MKTVARLVWTYFTATPLMSGLTALGIVLYGAGIVDLLNIPRWTLGSGFNHRYSLFWQGMLDALPWFAVTVLFFASTSLPAVVQRLAFGRQICALPRGRALLFLSAVLTAGLIALLTAISAVLAFLGFPTALDSASIFFRSFGVAFVDYGLMYVAIWIVGRFHGVWLLLGALLVLAGVALPLRFIAWPSVPLAWPISAGLAGWACFGAVILAGPRFGPGLAAVRGSLASIAGRIVPGTNYAPGSEQALLLGTGRPWIMAFGQIVPVAAAASLINDDRVLLFWLTILSAISAAITTHAAARSRALWLRTGWTRSELFRRVESAFWRHNAYPLGVLLLLLVGVGSLRGFSTQLMSFGIALLVLSAVLSSYLGLMMTKGLGWRDAALAAGTMLLLMTAALLIARARADTTLIVMLQLGLAALAIGYRYSAKSRWEAIDWMRCRSKPGSGRAARDH